VKQEGLLVGAFQRVDPLLVLACAKRRHDERLRLAAREQRRAMRAGYNVDLAIDGPHRFQIAPVDALAGLEDARPDDVLFDLLESVRELDLVAGRGLLRHKLRDNLGFRLADFRVALLLGRDLEGLLEILFHKLFDLSLVLVLRVRQNPWVFRGLFGNADDGVDDRTVCLLPEGHCTKHHLLGKLLRFRLDHENGVPCARNHEIEVGRLHLIRCGVEDVPPL
jgi:hypothetical protein